MSIQKREKIWDVLRSRVLMVLAEMRFEGMFLTQSIDPVNG